MSVEILFYCCTNNGNRSRVTLRSTFNNCHFLFGYLHIVALGSTIAHQAMLRVTYMYKQTSSMTNVVDNTVYSPTSAPSWTRTIVADRHKYSVIKRLSRRHLGRSKIAIFTYTACIWCPRWMDDAIGVLSRSFAHKTILGILCGVVCLILCSAVLGEHRFVTDKQTEKVPQQRIPH